MPLVETDCGRAGLLVFCHWTFDLGRFGCLAAVAFPMKTRPPWFYKQAGMIPYRRTDTGLEILLITSKRRGNWIVPKGIIDPGETAIQSACKEAYEEAGVKGAADPQIIG